MGMSDVIDLLAPAHVVRKKLVNKKWVMWYVMELMTPINKFLMEEVASPAQQSRYKALLAEGDRAALLREGMIQDPAVMAGFMKLWELFGGANAFHTILDEDAGMRKK